MAKKPAQTAPGSDTHRTDIAPLGRIFDKETGFTFAQCQEIWNGAEKDKGDHKKA